MYVYCLRKRKVSSVWQGHPSLVLNIRGWFAWEWKASQDVGLSLLKPGKSRETQVKFITLERGLAHRRTWSIPDPHSTEVPQTPPYISRRPLEVGSVPGESRLGCWSPCLGQRLAWPWLKWDGCKGDLPSPTNKHPSAQRKGEGGELVMLINTSWHGGVGSEEIDSVSIHLDKFSFICGSYSQEISSFHRIFELM